jgi:hypothetical protein
MTPNEPGPDPERRFDSAEGLLVLAADDALLVLHLLATFERLLRQGQLTDHQLGLLTAEGTGAAHAAADLLMAQVVGEAIDALRAQFDEP